MENIQNKELRERNLGIRYALAAYGTWGLLPLFWKLMNEVPAVQILSHRILWSFIYVCGLIVITNQKYAVKKVLKSPKNMLLFLASSSLLTVNWGVYIWANNNNQIVETSLGYFINPLVSIFLGMIFLKERIQFWQIFAVILASLGVGHMIFEYGKFPWIALILAFSFGIYALIRKIVPVESLVGLFIETGLMSPIAFIYVLWLGFEGKGVFISSGFEVSLLLMIAGVITAYPLMWLVNGAKRLPLKTIGFCQYLAPSLMLLMGVVVFKEPFTEMHRVTFALIWSALLIYSLSSTPMMQKINPSVLLMKQRERS